MIIQLKDIDDWKTSDFIRYIKLQCQMKHIEYNAEQKQSYMILGRAFKVLKLNNKSKSWLKKNIDTFLSNADGVTSLLFINYLLRTLPKKLNDNTIKNLPKVTTISDETKKKLVMLRSAL